MIPSNCTHIAKALCPEGAERGEIAGGSKPLSLFGIDGRAQLTVSASMELPPAVGWRTVVDWQPCVRIRATRGSEQVSIDLDYAAARLLAAELAELMGDAVQVDVETTQTRDQVSIAHLEKRFDDLGPALIGLLERQDRLEYEVAEIRRDQASDVGTVAKQGEVLNNLSQAVVELGDRTTHLELRVNDLMKTRRNV